MALFSTVELADLESSLAALLPDDAYSTGTKYDCRLQNPQPAHVILVPPPRLVARQSAVDFEQLNFKASDPVPAVGDVVTFTTIDNMTRWFIVVKNLTLGPEIYTRIPVNSLVIEMPYNLTFQRPDTANGMPLRTIFGDPVDPTTVPTTKQSFPVGFTNNLNQLGETVVGPLPSGELTAYTYFGADVQVDDVVDYNNTHYYVKQANQKYGNGFEYCLELILKETGGKTWTK